MKRFLPFGVLVFAWLSVIARGGEASAAAEGAAPQAKFEQTSVDFGRVMPSEIQKHEFVVTNAGTAPLLITSVQASCGCTTPGGWDREIAPGKSGKIPIEFNPSNFNGPVTKAVTVSSNDPQQPTRVLEIKADVWRPFTVQPTFANFLPIEGEASTETKAIRLINNAEEPATLEAPQSSDPRFKTELKTVKPGREFELLVTYDSDASAAAPSTSITIATSNPEQPTLTVTAFAMPQPPIVTMPALLHVPAEATGQNYNHNIVIRNNGSTPLQVTEPSATLETITVKLTEPRPGKLFYLNVTIPKDFHAPPQQPAFVTVKTSHPRFPEIRVPIVQPAPPARQNHAAAP